VSGSIRLADVAREAGVSLATASRVLNGSKRVVSQPLRDHVLVIAERLGYSPNATAQAMVRGHLDFVGVIVHDIADPYFSSIAAGVMQRAEEAGMLVALSSASRGTHQEAEYLAAFRRQRVRAVILVGSRTKDPSVNRQLIKEIGLFHETGGRVAAVTQRGLPVDTVVVQNRAGARALAEALVGLGYSRFGVLAGPRALVTANDRLAGFREGLERAGLSLEQSSVISGEFTRDGGYASMTELLARESKVDCVFAINDVMAVGAMAALRDHGVADRTLGIAGFDDIITLRDVSPGLTTVRVDLESLGRSAMDLALMTRNEKPRSVIARYTVVVRDSTPQRR
jgi:LacI family transcriptional regulator